MNLKRALSSLFTLCLAASLLTVSSSPASAEAPAATQTANVVIVVDFADTVHTGHSEFSCLNKNPASLVDSFNGDSARSMKNYISSISCGKLQVTNLFPQYDESSAKLQAYRLPNNESCYADQGMRNMGSAIIQDILGPLQRDTAALDSLDLEKDGIIDNLTLVIPSNQDGKAPIDSHQSRYFGSETVNGLRIGSYTLLTEYDLALGASVACHEFLHTRGYPDLYVNAGAKDNCHPVGPWCCMSTTTYNYPLTYLRGCVSNWLKIPTVTTSTSGYSLHAVSADDSSEPQAVILKTDLSSSEFFVVEYRRKNTDLRGLDYHIPGSGLIIYRVNLLSSSNFSGAPYLIYVFRPGDSRSNGNEMGRGDTSGAFLSQESGRVSLGSTDLSHTLEEGALTYSDGRNSGIVISNVGSASGDAITFDIQYAALPEDSYWSTSGSGMISTTITDSFLDSDGTLYYLESDHCNIAPSDVFLSKLDGENWTRRLSSVLSTGTATRLFLQKYGTDFFVGYYSGGKANLSKWDGTRWSPLYSVQANDMDMTADSSGVYLAYTSPDNTAISVYRYTALGSGLLGGEAAYCGYAANLSVTAENGTVAFTYRDFDCSDRVCAKVYGADQSWMDVSPLDLSSSGGAVIKLHADRLYLLTSGSQGNHLYCRGLDLDDLWAKLGDSYAGTSIVDQQLCFAEGSPCIVYKRSTSQQAVSVLEAVQLLDGDFVPMGEYLARDTGLSAPRLYTCHGKLYAAYLSGDGYASKHLNLKYYQPRPEHTHSYGSWSVEVSPTCTQDGTEQRTCSICGNRERRSIPTSGHSWDNSPTVDTPATYSHPGSQSIHCTICGAVRDITEIPAILNPFEDVRNHEDSYYYAPVLWALDAGVTAGKTETTFAPFEGCTRGQVVTFLWRAAGSPEPMGNASFFLDVQDPNAFYYKPVLWAAENGITTGTDTTHFSPNRTVTRGQFVTFLWRLAGTPGSAGSHPFQDLSASGFYYDAVLWAVENGITTGTSTSLFSPNNTCQRGQTVTFLYRYYAKLSADSATP